MAMTATSFTSANPAARLQNYLRSVEGLLRAGDTLRAAQIAAEAIANGCEHANLLTLAALHRLNRRENDQALVLATRACEFAPRNPDVLNMLGMAQVAAGHGREALASYDVALRQAPTAAHIRMNRGQALENLNEVGRARTDYEHVLSLVPRHIGAMSRLAALAGLRGDFAEARRHGDAVLAQEPRNEAALLALAMADVEEKQFEAALARVALILGNPSVSAVNRAIAQGLEADALDGLNKVPEAFAAYGRSNATMRAAYAPVFAATGLETAMQRVERLIDYFNDAGPEWRARTPSYKSPVQTHVFLLGFPRSGTTLLERVMDTHPDMEAMPERECLMDAGNDLTGSSEALDRLARLDGDNLARYRKSYWDSVRTNWRAPSRRIFIDKMPLNTISICLIAKLFPDAKILFAIRDPRDVVLSCFRRRFGMTAQMFELLSLENAVHYYDRVMQLATLYRDKLAPDLHQIRYEDMVKHFEAELRRICAFLGAEWSDAIRDFAQAASVKDVGTPSAPQIARGLYTQGIGQWRRYATQMESVLPVLAPWIARFSYREN